MIWKPVTKRGKIHIYFPSLKVYTEGKGAPTFDHVLPRDFGYGGLSKDLESIDRGRARPGDTSSSEAGEVASPIDRLAGKNLARGEHYRAIRPLCLRDRHDRRRLRKLWLSNRRTFSALCHWRCNKAWIYIRQGSTSGLKFFISLSRFTLTYTYYMIEWIVLSEIRLKMLRLKRP